MPITSIARTTRRYVAVAGVLVVALTGCSAGFGAQTQQPYQAGDGTNADSGPIAVRNLVVVADEEGHGRFQAAIVNNGDADDRLTKLDVVNPPEARVTGMRTFTLFPGQLVEVPPGSGKPIEISGAEPGGMLQLTLTFGDAAPITTWVPVVTEDHYSPTPEQGGGGH